jgi:hypothetical protein
MRLQAGTSLLRLAGVKAYADVITQTATFVDLALVAQDEQHEVRKQFVKTLLMLLVARTLSPKFNVVVFIVAHDPEPEIPNMVSDVGMIGYFEAEGHLQVRGYVKSMFSALSSRESLSLLLGVISADEGDRDANRGVRDPVHQGLAPAVASSGYGKYRCGPCDSREE